MMTLDRPAFHALFKSERDRTFRFLLRLTRNHADAEDLLQESFLTVWRKREQFEGRGSAGGYLRRTAYHLYLNRRNRDERRAALTPLNGKPLSEPPADLRVERREAVEFLVERVREALAHLPEPARLVFVLFRFEGLTCAEIAELTDTHLKTVETRLLRATRALAARLETHREQMP